MSAEHVRGSKESAQEQDIGNPSVRHSATSKTKRGSLTPKVSSKILSLKYRSNSDIKPSKRSISSPYGSVNKIGGDIISSLTPSEMHSLEKEIPLGLPRPSHSITSALRSINVELSNVGHDTKYTKLFLQKQGLYNMSIWSHLTDVLNKIIAEQPDNVIDYFEEYSRKVKEEKLLLHDTLRDIFAPSPHLESAQNQLKLVGSYIVKDDAEETVAEEKEEANEVSKKMDLEEVAFYFFQAGIVTPDVQIFTVNIAMKKLAEEKNLFNTRFWGKVLGTKQDYFVIESELTEEEYERRAEEDELAEQTESERLAAEQMEAQTVEEAQFEEKIEPEEEGEETNQEGITDETYEGKDAVLERKQSEEEIALVDEDLKIEEERLPSIPNVSEPQEIKFSEPEFKDIVEEEEALKEEEEDPLLPALPPPKKLLKYKVPPILKPVLKESLKLPTEKIGQGVNRKVYFVSNAPELEWTELPKVTPDQINVARQIQLFFTGDLDFKMETYPQFSGGEKNYLRTQIARISAATQVSPLGFYKFGRADGEEEEEEEEVAEEEEEEEGGGDKTNYIENPKFQPIPVKDLIDPSLAYWVHHSQHILKQGRTSWWSAKKAEIGEEEAEEEQEEEEEEEGGDGGKEEKETGPQLLTPLSEDALIEGMPAWTLRKTHNFNNDASAAVIKSNLWPGACAVASGKKFENIYIGWGKKNLPFGFSPTQLPHPEYEYDLGPEIMEIQDPTVEVEEAWRQAHKKKPPPQEGEENEDEDGEEEEEEEEEDD